MAASATRMAYLLVFPVIRRPKRPDKKANSRHSTRKTVRLMVCPACEEADLFYSLTSSKSPHNPICFPEMMTIPWTPVMHFPAAMAGLLSLGVWT